MARKKPTPESALRVIRTWAKYQQDTGALTLVPSQVMKLCDDALSLCDKNSENKVEVSR